MCALFAAFIADINFVYPTLSLNIFSPAVAVIADRTAYNVQCSRPLSEAAVISIIYTKDFDAGQLFSLL